MLGCISGALQWLQYRHAQAGGLLFLPVHHFLFLYCLCLAVGGPEPKPDSDRKLGVLQLPCADFDTFPFKIPNCLNTCSLIIKPLQQVSQCAFQSGGRIPSGFRLILNAAFKTYKCLTVRHAVQFWSSLGDEVLDVAFSNGLLHSKVNTHNGHMNLGGRRERRREQMKNSFLMTFFLAQAPRAGLGVMDNLHQAKQL